MNNILSSLIIVCCAVFLFEDCGKKPTEVSGTGSGTGNAMISGMVIDKFGQPAAGAIAILRPYDFVKDTLNGTGQADGKSAETHLDNKGQYSFNDIDTGKYNIEINNGRHEAVLRTFKLSSDEPISLTDTLKSTGTFTGTIQAAVPDSVRSIYVAIVGLDRISRIDSLGMYAFDDLPEGNYNIKIITPPSSYIPSDSLTCEVKPNQIDSGKAVSLLPAIRRQDINVSASFIDTALPIATIRDSFLLLIVRKPDTLAWNSSDAGNIINPTSLKASGLGKEPVAITPCTNAVITSFGNGGFNVRWPVINISSSASGIHIFAVVKPSGNGYQYVNIIEAKDNGPSGLRLANKNPWAVILE